MFSTPKRREGGDGVGVRVDGWGNWNGREGDSRLLYRIKVCFMAVSKSNLRWLKHIYPVYHSWNQELHPFKCKTEIHFIKKMINWVSGQGEDCMTDAKLSLGYPLTQVSFQCLLTVRQTWPDQDTKDQLGITTQRRLFNIYKQTVRNKHNSSDFFSFQKYLRSDDRRKRLLSFNKTSWQCSDNYSTPPFPELPNHTTSCRKWMKLFTATLRFCSHNSQSSLSISLDWLLSYRQRAPQWPRRRSHYTGMSIEATTTTA